MAKYTLPNLSADHVLEVLFRDLAAFFTVTVNSGPGGIVALAGEVVSGPQSLAAGGTYTFEIMPDPGKELDKIMLDGVEVAPDAE